MMPTRRDAGLGSRRNREPAARVTGGARGIGTMLMPWPFEQRVTGGARGSGPPRLFEKRATGRARGSGPC